ncbi:hypothetical protein CC80DRAFT_533966 [Byssothecium circinans]|uniref:Uncharacterized protein n=1 Tax=Byssothecium circinans TaxID=147558 RepID=A0A6A5TZ18_9PLEO|nr:hypothetical protein CC80DRAFT_533966 [Byssothecium circinans]
MAHTKSNDNSNRRGYGQGKGRGNGQGNGYGKLHTHRPFNYNGGVQKYDARTGYGGRGGTHAGQGRNQYQDTQQGNQGGNYHQDGQAHADENGGHGPGAQQDAQDGRTRPRGGKVNRFGRGGYAKPPRNQMQLMQGILKDQREREANASAEQQNRAARISSTMTHILDTINEQQQNRAQHNDQMQTYGAAHILNTITRPTNTMNEQQKNRAQQNSYMQTYGAAHTYNRAQHNNPMQTYGALHIDNIFNGQQNRAQQYGKMQTYGNPHIYNCAQQNDQMQTYGAPHIDNIFNENHAQHNSPIQTYGAPHTHNTFNGQQSRAQQYGQMQTYGPIHTYNPINGQQQYHHQQNSQMQIPGAAHNDYYMNERHNGQMQTHGATHPHNTINEQQHHRQPQPQYPIYNTAIKAMNLPEQKGRNKRTRQTDLRGHESSKKLKLDESASTPTVPKEIKIKGASAAKDPAPSNLQRQILTPVLRSNNKTANDNATAQVQQHSSRIPVQTAPQIEPQTIRPHITRTEKTPVLSSSTNVNALAQVCQNTMQTHPQIEQQATAPQITRPSKIPVPNSNTSVNATTQAKQLPSQKPMQMPHQIEPQANPLHITRPSKTPVSNSSTNNDVNQPAQAMPLSQQPSTNSQSPVQVTDTSTPANSTQPIPAWIPSKATNNQTHFPWKYKLLPWDTNPILMVKSDNPIYRKPYTLPAFDTPEEKLDFWTKKLAPVVACLAQPRAARGFGVTLRKRAGPPAATVINDIDLYMHEGTVYAAINGIGLATIPVYLKWRGIDDDTPLQFIGRRAEWAGEFLDNVEARQPWRPWEERPYTTFLQGQKDGIRELDRKASEEVEKLREVRKGRPLTRGETEEFLSLSTRTKYYYERLQELNSTPDTQAVKVPGFPFTHNEVKISDFEVGTRGRIDVHACQADSEGDVWALGRKLVTGEVGVFPYAITEPYVPHVPMWDWDLEALTSPPTTGPDTEGPEPARPSPTQEVVPPAEGPADDLSNTEACPTLPPAYTYMPWVAKGMPKWEWDSRDWVDWGEDDDLP